MNITKFAFRHHSKIWTLLFAIVSGAFITGMTGYVTMGSNYPLVFLASVLINYIIANMVTGYNTSDQLSFFNNALHLFNGRLGQFFANFIGMFLLIILLIIATGEGEQGAYAFKAIAGLEIDIRYHIGILGFFALVPILFGLKRGLNTAFFLFCAIILFRAIFILWSIGNMNDMPAWNISNLYQGFQVSDLVGSHGIIYIGFRLTFWSLVAIEVFRIWNKFGYRAAKKVRYLVIATAILLITMVPGIYLAGLFPLELWQLIINGDEGCFGDCAALALGLNMGGTIGYHFMAWSSIISHMLMMSICFLLISRILQFLSTKGLLFRHMNVRSELEQMENPNEYAMLTAFVLTLVLSWIRQESSMWLGLGLYMTFGMVLIVQSICLLNLHFKWFETRMIGNRAFCVLTILSVILLGILFYSGFKGSHQFYLNVSIPILCFSLWIAATSVVYLMRSKEVSS